MESTERIRGVIFADESVRDALLALREGKFEEKRLLGWLEEARAALMADPFVGVRVERKLWPKIYFKKYEINNLWKYDLQDGWRLIYTVRGNEVEIMSVILEWLSHKQYERRFGYKAR